MIPDHLFYKIQMLKCDSSKPHSRCKVCDIKTCPLQVKKDYIAKQEKKTPRKTTLNMFHTVR